MPKKKPIDPPPKTHEIIWIRMPVALVRELDKQVKRERRAAPHAPEQSITRSSVLRGIVHAWADKGAS